MEDFLVFLKYRLIIRLKFFLKGSDKFSYEIELLFDDLLWKFIDVLIIKDRFVILSIFCEPISNLLFYDLNPIIVYSLLSFLNTILFKFLDQILQVTLKFLEYRLSKIKDKCIEKCLTHWLNFEACFILKNFWDAFRAHVLEMILERSYLVKL